MSTNKMNVPIPDNILAGIEKIIAEAGSVAFVVFGGSNEVNSAVIEKLTAQKSPLYGIEAWYFGAPIDRHQLQCYLSNEKMQSTLAGRGSIVINLPGRAITFPSNRPIIADTLRKQGAERVVGIFVDFDNKFANKTGKVNRRSKQFAAELRNHPPRKDTEEWDSLYTIHLGRQP